MKFYREDDDKTSRRARKKLKYRDKSRKHGYGFCQIVVRLTEERAKQVEKVEELLGGLHGSR